MFNLQQNKYSKKCLDTIKNNKFYKIKPFNNKLLSLLEKIYNKTTNNYNNYNIIYDKELKKLHETTQYPLIYMHYLEINKDDNNKLDFNSFYKYYIENIDEYNNLLNKKSKIMELINNPIKDRKKLHDNIYDNNFVSIDIHQIAESNNIKYKEININEHKVYLYEMKKNINLDFLSFIILFMENLAQEFNLICKPLELILFMSSQKKLFTNKNFLGPENINSGSTYSGYKVFIWRIEEVYKVLIHELIHFYGFDKQIFKDVLQKTKEHHCIIGQDRENESYTEIFAIIIHTYILSKNLKYNFFDLINYEINFSLYQCKKIMNFFNIMNIEDIINNNSCNNPINQKTSVFSYFFLKTCLLLNLEKSMNYIYENNHNNYDYYIKKVLINVSILNNLNYTFDNNNLKSKFFFNTLRMSCLEFN